MSRADVLGRPLVLSRLLADDGTVYALVAWPGAGASTPVVVLDTGVLVPLWDRDLRATSRPAAGFPEARLAITLAALRQRAQERLGAPATPDPSSRVPGGRQRATSRRGGAR